MSGWYAAAPAAAALAPELGGPRRSAPAGSGESLAPRRALAGVLAAGSLASGGRLILDLDRAIEERDLEARLAGVADVIFDPAPLEARGVEFLMWPGRDDLARFVFSHCTTDEETTALCQAIADL